MSEPSPTRRLRWYQFRLRSLLLLMTLLVLTLGAWRIYISPQVARYRRQQQTIELIEKLGGSYEATPAPDWLRRLTGEDFKDVGLVDLADSDAPDAYIDQVAALPKLEMLAVGGEKFTDEHLQRLQGTKALRGLVLDSADVTPAGVEALKRSLPDLDLHLSPRRLIAAKPFAISGFSGDIGGTHDELRQRLGLKFFQIYPSEITLQVAAADDPRLRQLWQLNGLLLQLTMNGQGVTDDSLRHLERLTDLWRLYLKGSPLTDAGLPRLQGMQELQELSLSGSRVTDDGLRHLTPLRKLWGLYLDNTSVTDAGLESLRAVTQLKILHLSGSKVTAEGVRKFKEAMPTCKVTWDARPNQ